MNSLGRIQIFLLQSVTNAALICIGSTSFDNDLLKSFVMTAEWWYWTALDALKVDQRLQRLMAGSDDVVSDEYAERNSLNSSRIAKSH